MKNALAVRDEYRKQHWTEIIRERQESRVTARDYCAQHGLAEKTYYCLRKLRSVAAEAMELQLVRLEESNSSTTQMIHIRYGTAELILPENVDVPKAIRCGCWAHMRRKWREAMPKGATPTTSKEALGYEYRNKLFSLEKKYEGYSAKQRMEMRQAQTVPVLDAYRAWVEKLEPEPGSKLDEAVRYARSQKQSLNWFLAHGDVDISNNLAENAIRPFVIGRKNWLFCDTPKGAETSAAVYSCSVPYSLTKYSNFDSSHSSMSSKFTPCFDK